MGGCHSKGEGEEDFVEGDEVGSVGVEPSEEGQEAASAAGEGEEGLEEGEPAEPPPPKAKFSIAELINGIEGSQEDINRKRAAEQEEMDKLATEVAKIDAMTPAEYEAAEDALLANLAPALQGAAMQLRADGGPSQLDLIKQQHEAKVQAVSRLQQDLENKIKADEQTANKATADPGAPKPQLSAGKQLHQMLKTGEIVLKDDTNEAELDWHFDEAVSMEKEDQQTYLQFITPKVDKALFIQEKRVLKLSKKMDEMSKLYLRDPAATKVGQSALPWLGDATESSLIVVACLFESGRNHNSVRKDGSTAPWPPNSLDSLDFTRKAVPSALQFLVDNLGAGRVKLDLDDEYEGHKKSVRAAFSFGLQDLLQQHLVTKLLEEADFSENRIGPDLALQEAREFLLKAVELAVQSILPGLMKFLEAIEEILDEAYKKVQGNVETEFDSDIVIFFNRVAFGPTATISSPEELDNLCMNLAYKYNGYVTLPSAEDITEFCLAQDITEASGWDVDQFRKWFNGRLRYRSRTAP